MPVKVVTEKVEKRNKKEVLLKNIKKSIRL